MLLMLPIMLVRESARALSKAAYKDPAGSLHGALVSFAAAGSVGHYYGWTKAWSTTSWLGAAVVAWFITFWYTWPILYLIAVKPALKLVNLAVKSFQDLCRNYAHNIFSSIINFLGKLLPGSATAWANVNARRINWVNIFVEGLAYPVSLSISAWSGWELYCFLERFLGSTTMIPGAGAAASACAGFFSALTLAAVLFALIGHGRIPFVVVSAGILLDVACANQISALGAVLPFGGSIIFIIHTAVFAMFVGYIYPFLNLLLCGGWVKKLLFELKEILKRTYLDKNYEYAEFFQTVVGLVLTVLACVGINSGINAVHLFPLWATAAISACTLPLVYHFTHRLIFNAFTVLLAGMVLSVCNGIWAASNYNAHCLPGGILIASLLGVVTSVATGLVLFPLVYLRIKSFCLYTGISRLGKGLKRFHKAVEGGCHKLFKCIGHSLVACYCDKSGYEIWFAHTANIILAIAASVLLPSITQLSQSSLHFQTAIHSQTGGCSVAILPFQLVTFMLSYTLVGRVLTKAPGIIIIGVLSSLAGSTWVSSCAAAAGNSHFHVGFAGLLSWLACFVICFPLSYLVMRPLLKNLVASWSTNMLVGLHNLAWACFAAIWRLIATAWMEGIRLLRQIFGFCLKILGGFIIRFVKAYLVVYRAIMPQVLRACWAAAVAIHEAYRSLRSRI